MGLLARVRELTSGPERRLLRDLSLAHRDELRMARQLREHAARVPYPTLSPTLTALADEEEGHATLIEQAATRLGGRLDAAEPAPTRGGHNYWERLAVDLGDLRAKSKRYLELALHWDLDEPETAALFTRLAHEEAAMGRVLADLVARSDPHAQD